MFLALGSFGLFYNLGKEDKIMPKTLRQRKKELRGQTYKPLKSGKFHVNWTGTSKPLTRKQVKSHRRDADGRLFPRRPIKGEVEEANREKGYRRKVIGLSKIYGGRFARCNNCNAKNVVKGEGVVTCMKCGTKFKAVKHG